MATEDVRWDLSEIFPSINDPSIAARIAEVRSDVDSFARKYKGRISSLTGMELCAAIQESERMDIKFDDLSMYASASFNADMTSPQAQTLNDKISKLGAEISSKLTFFDLELSALIKAKPFTVSDPALAAYKHALERVGRQAEHLLSELEEQLTIEKDQFGVDAWSELQSKWLSTRMITLKIEGQDKTIPYGEARALLTNPNRLTREAVNRAIYSKLGEDGEIFSSALRNICNDWIKVCERRKYSSPMEASLIYNDTDKRIIESLIGSIEKGAALYQRYLRLKAKLMGLGKLGSHDIAAPLPDSPSQNFSYKQAQEMILNAYSNFDPEYAGAVKDMFEKNHIDVAPRAGKENNAYCSSWYRGKSAFVLINFNGSLVETYTLAHELGHATHDYYALSRQSPMNLHMPVIVAETASIFGELLMTDTLLKEAKSATERRAILSHVLDEAGMAAFQVTARIWFEQALYDAIKGEKYLDYETICGLWTGARDRIYGDAVEWLPEMKAEWTMKVHYYMPNFRFYNYPYVYAQMFVYALYEKYLEDGKSFIPKFKEALSLGSSKSPAEIASSLGLDVSDPSFWELGLRRYEKFLEELKKLG